MRANTLIAILTALTPLMARPAADPAIVTVTRWHTVQVPAVTDGVAGTPTGNGGDGGHTATDNDSDTTAVNTAATAQDTGAGEPATVTRATAPAATGGAGDGATVTATGTAAVTHDAEPTTNADTTPADATTAFTGGLQSPAAPTTMPAEGNTGAPAPTGAATAPAAPAETLTGANGDTTVIVDATTQAAGTNTGSPTAAPTGAATDNAKTSVDPSDLMWATSWENGSAVSSWVTGTRTQLPTVTTPTVATSTPLLPTASPIRSLLNATSPSFASKTSPATTPTPTPSPTLASAGVGLSVPIQCAIAAVLFVAAAF